MPRTKMAVEQYKTQTEMSIPERIADYLDHYAKSAPGRWRTAQDLARAAYLLPRLPMEKSKEVKQVKGRMSSAKKILMERYGRTVIANPGYGYRATTDSEDVAGDALEKAARRVVSSAEGLDKTRALITMSEIRDPQKRKRVEEVSRATRVLVSNEVMERLRLPEKKPNGEDK